MTTVIWAFSTILGLLSLLIIYMNYRIWFGNRNWKPGEKHISELPIIGGLLGFFALRITHFATVPQNGWEGYAWLPLLLDPGCYIVMIVLLPIELLLKRLFNRNEATTKDNNAAS